MFARPVKIPLAKSARECQRREVGTPCWCARYSVEPVRESVQVHGYRCSDVLQMRLSPAPVARLPQAEGAYPVR